MARIVRILVVLAIPRRVGELLTLARAVAEALARDPATFPKPNPSLANLNTAIAALDTAETATRTRARGTVQTRNEKRAALVTLLHHLRAYVQQIVDANPDRAVAIAQSASMNIRKPTVRLNPLLAVKPGPVSGTVLLAARAVERRSANEWQYSIDQKSWQSAAPSLQTRTEIANLQPGTLTYFRHRAVTKAGPGDWSQPVAAIVQ